MPSYTQVNLGLTYGFNIGTKNPLTARVDLINVFDKACEIPSGTGVGVLASQSGRGAGCSAGSSGSSEPIVDNAAVPAAPDCI